MHTMQYTTTLKPKAIMALALLAAWHLKVQATLTQGGIVTADSIRTSTVSPQFSNCKKLADGKWPSDVFDTPIHCCSSTNTSVKLTWFNIDMGDKRIVKTVMIINREDYASSYIQDSDLHVGDNSQPNLNTACDVNPQSSGVYSCGGKIGRYLGIVKNNWYDLFISQIRAYSYDANAYPYQQYLTSGITECASDTNLVFTNTHLITEKCKMPVSGNPAYYNIVFDVERYIQTVTVVGAAKLDFAQSKNWFVSVGSQTGSAITLNTVYDQYINDQYDQYGKEIQVKAYGSSVGIYRQDGGILQFRWIGIFTTATDCTGSFDWSGSRTSWRIPIKTTAQVITGSIAAKISDCAVFQGALVKADGSALPSFIIYDIYTKIATVNVSALQTPITITVKACAFMQDKVTVAKSDCKNDIDIVIFKSETVSWSQENFYFETEKLSTQVVFELPAITSTPSDAIVEVTYTLNNGAPSFLTIQKTGLAAKGVISASPTADSYLIDVTATDPVSTNTSILKLTLLVYNCQPTGFQLAPNSLTIRESGPSETTEWSTPVYSACGSYSATIQTEFSNLLSISGYIISAQAPLNAVLGTFKPVITLRRDSNPAQFATAELTVIVLAPLMTSLTFDLTPPATSFYFETEQLSAQVIFDFPGISWQPSNAEKIISFQLTGTAVPGFLSLQQVGTAAKGVVSTSATTGRFAYQVVVSDSVSNLSATLNATLLVYDCQPTGFQIMPSSLTIRISGPSLISTWSQNPLHLLCGSYSAQIDSSFVQIFTVSGQQIVAQVPQTVTTIGNFNPVFTLKRDSNHAQATTVSLDLRIKDPLMTSLAFKLISETFYFETELTGNQVEFNFPAITWAPINADKEISFQLIGAPEFLTVQYKGTTAQGIISQSMTVGTFGYKIIVTDSVSLLSVTLKAILLIYSCQPTGFVQLPSNVVSIMILGASKTLTWSQSPTYQACGSYQVKVEKEFNTIIKVNGQNLVIFAPETTNIGSFNPVITLIRDRNPNHFVSGSLSLTITRCVVNALSFSQPPESRVILDLNTNGQPIGVPFKTKQTPQCNYKVVFALVSGNLNFLSVKAYTLTNGLIFVQEPPETNEATYAATLRAFVDGQAAEAEFSVIVRPKQEAPAVDELTGLEKQVKDWRASELSRKTLEKTKFDEGKFVPKIPNPFFKEIKVNGNIQVGFSSQVNIVPNLQMINNGTIYLEDIEGYGDSGRELGISTVKNANKKKIPVLQVEVIPGLESQAQDLSFRWNVTQQNPKALQVQLYFDYPLNVSAQAIPDSVRITFNDPFMFTGINGLTMQTQVLENFLPQQIAVSRVDTAMLKILDSTASFGKAIVIGNFFLNILMSTSLNQLWSLIHTQQLIVLMPLFDIQLPANSQSFFSQIFKIASFNIIDIEPFINKVLNLNQTGPLKPNFNTLGFRSFYFLNNMNFILLGFNFYFSLVLLFLILDRMQVRFKILSPLAEQLRHMLFYNLILSILTQSYFMIAICSMIGLNKLSADSFGDFIQSTSSIFALLVLIVFPILVFWVIRKIWDQKDLNQTKEQYQPIFESLKTEIGPLALVDPMYFLFRRLFMAIIVVFLKQHLIFQVLLKDFSIIAGVLVAAQIHHNNKVQRRKEFFNEAIVMCVLYCIICFSPFVPDIRARQVMGYVCCLLVSIHLALNLYLIQASSLNVLKIKVRFWYALKRQQWQREQNRIKLKYRKHALRDNILANLDKNFHELQLSEMDQSELEDDSSSSFDFQIIGEEESVYGSEEEVIEDESGASDQNLEIRFKVQEQLDSLEKLVSQSNSEEFKEETILTRPYTPELEHRSKLENFGRMKNRSPIRKSHDNLDYYIHNVKSGTKRSEKVHQHEIFGHKNKKKNDFLHRQEAAEWVPKPDMKQEVDQIDTIILQLEQKWNTPLGDPNLDELSKPQSQQAKHLQTYFTNRKYIKRKQQQ